jgi:adenylosuccinate synthase
MSGVEAEDAKKEVAECEKEIGTIKALLRGLGPAAEDESESNEFKVAFLKVRTLFDAKP